MVGAQISTWAWLRYVERQMSNMDIRGRSPRPRPLGVVHTGSVGAGGAGRPGCCAPLIDLCFVVMGDFVIDSVNVAQASKGGCRSTTEPFTSVIPRMLWGCFSSHGLLVDRRLFRPRVRFVGSRRVKLQQYLGLSPLRAGLHPVRGLRHHRQSGQQPDHQPVRPSGAGRHRAGVDGDRPGRQVGGAVAIAVFGSLIVSSKPFLPGVRASLVIAAVLLLITALISVQIRPQDCGLEGPQVAYRAAPTGSRPDDRCPRLPGRPALSISWWARALRQFGLSGRHILSCGSQRAAGAPQKDATDGSGVLAGFTAQIRPRS